VRLRAIRRVSWIAACISLLTPLKAQQTNDWMTLTQQATVLINQGRFADAMPIARQALAVAKRAYTTQSLQYALSLNGIGYLELATGDLASAQTDLESAAVMVQAAAGKNSVQAMTPLANLGNLYLQQAQLQSANPTLQKSLLGKAETALREVLSIAEANFKGADVNLSPPLQALAQVLCAEQKFTEAIQVEQRLLTIARANLPADNPLILKTRADLATTILASGDTSTALSQLKAVLVDAKRILPVGDSFTAAVQDIINQISEGP
jgi:tetratricopeptide (TPR) repeat protein